MCFSPQADLVGGAVLVVIGVDALRHVRQRRSHVPLAALPLLLAGHQIVEAFAWWGLQGVVPSELGAVAAWIYVFVAFVVLPVYIPVAIWLLEPPGRRRQVISGFVVLGAVVGAVLLAGMIRGPVVSTLADFHISYDTGTTAGFGIVIAYILATCGSVLFSGRKYLMVFGIVNIVAVVVLARYEIEGFASLWCMWAAITSGGIALFMRAGRLTPVAAAVLAT